MKIQPRRVAPGMVSRGRMRDLLCLPPLTIIAATFFYPLVYFSNQEQRQKRPDVSSARKGRIGKRRSEARRKPKSPQRRKKVLSVFLLYAFVVIDKYVKITALSIPYKKANKLFDFHFLAKPLFAAAEKILL